MRKAANPKKAAAAEVDEIAAYAAELPPARRAICNLLRRLIDATLTNAGSRVWHGSPVWFIDANPVAGYSNAAKGVSLLFWNGQAFAEPELKPVGKYRAAQVTFGDAAEIDAAVIRRWLRKAKADVFDSRAFFKKLREGR